MTDRNDNFFQSALVMTFLLKATCLSSTKTLAIFVLNFKPCIHLLLVVSIIFGFGGTDIDSVLISEPFI